MKDFAALPKDGLNAAHMNAKPGGEQPCTHSTFYGPNNTPQEMVFPANHPTHPNLPKGMCQILKERGLWSDELVADCKLCKGKHTKVVDLKKITIIGPFKSGHTSWLSNSNYEKYNSALWNSETPLGKKRSEDKLISKLGRETKIWKKKVVEKKMPKIISSYFHSDNSGKSQRYTNAPGTLLGGANNNNNDNFFTLEQILKVETI
ncbi:21360_t:CDS:2 [Entrophospora sp. SA101]|nr:21360_t:CDS:2 [Entrophospora sp. SA101]